MMGFLMEVALMFGWLKKKSEVNSRYLNYLNNMHSLSECIYWENKSKTKPRSYYISLMRNNISLYHTLDKIKCKITSVDWVYGDDGCDITLESLNDYGVSRYRLRNEDIHWYFKEIVKCQ